MDDAVEQEEREREKRVERREEVQLAGKVEVGIK